ncbi:MAG: tRNA lysidine(34) synthetase TilS [Clostridiales Family XIII bacterium]|jgi:tRNA(Ile)-lysidine synthase|nr:tRNA lysidine(34) synthetase TilS [Clostridiales Family XIII bacterium]
MKMDSFGLGLIPEGGHVIVGFSGGADSSCLLHMLHALQRQEPSPFVSEPFVVPFGITAVHVNHGLRSGEADADQAHCEAFCQKLGVPITVVHVDVTSLAAALNQTTEEAGRTARYSAFLDAAQEAASASALPAAKVRIALAHNKNDRIETVLMRLLRGTGPDGLAAMTERRSGEGLFDVIRPLIDTDRIEIERYCAENGISFCTDSTNEKTDFLRNKLRLELLPLLASEYNPAIGDALFRLSVAAAEDRDYFGGIIQSVLEEHRVFSEGGAVLSCSVLAAAHPAVRHRIVKRVFAEIGLTQDISAVHLAAADELIVKGLTGKRVDFPNGYRLEISYEQVVFSGSSPFVSEPFPTASPRLITEYLSPQEALRCPVGEAGIDLDAERLIEADAVPALRTRKSGDRISPEGMDGSRKLQDVFVDLKIPRGERDALPLLAVGSEVLLIPGIRKSRLYKPNEVTTKICRYLIVYD